MLIVCQDDTRTDLYSLVVQLPRSDRCLICAVLDASCQYLRAQLMKKREGAGGR